MKKKCTHAYKIIKKKKKNHKWILSKEPSFGQDVLYVKLFVQENEYG